MGAIRVKRNSENLYAENADEFLNILIQRWKACQISTKSI
jgi:hypothetical protein